jgi:hypothetical protein
MIWNLGEPKSLLQFRPFPDDCHDATEVGAEEFPQNQESEQLSKRVILAGILVGLSGKRSPTASASRATANGDFVIRGPPCPAPSFHNDQSHTSKTPYKSIEVFNRAKQRLKPQAGLEYRK